MSKNIRWRLDNQRPFSQMKTEVLREGKLELFGFLRSSLFSCIQEVLSIEKEITKGLEKLLQEMKS